MGRWVIALLAAGVALVAASARAQTEQVVLAPTVYASHDLPANAITSFTVTCPRGYVPVSAGVSTPAPGTTLLKVAPVVGGYGFRFGNPVTNGDQRVTVAVTCRKIRAPGRFPKIVLKLTPQRTKYVTVPPRKAAAATFVCPEGTTPAGAGADLDPAGQKSFDAYRGVLPLSIRRQTSTLDRLSFSVLNTGGKAQTVALYGGCLTLLRKAGGPAERLHVKVTTVRVGLHPGNQTVTRRCARGWFSLAAGYALLTRPTSAPGAAATRGGARWSLVADTDTGTKADLQLVCGRLAP